MHERNGTAAEISTRKAVSIPVFRQSLLPHLLRPTPKQMHVSGSDVQETRQLCHRRTSSKHKDSDSSRRPTVLTGPRTLCDGELTGTPALYRGVRPRRLGACLCNVSCNELPACRYCIGVRRRDCVTASPDVVPRRKGSLRACSGRCTLCDDRMSTSRPYDSDSRVYGIGECKHDLSTSRAP